MSEQGVARARGAAHEILAAPLIAAAFRWHVEHAGKDGLPMVFLTFLADDNTASVI